MKRTNAIAQVLLVTAAALAWSSPAGAQDVFERFAPDLEVYGIFNLESEGSAAFNPGVGGAIHLSVNLVKGLGLHGGAQFFVLTPADNPSTYYLGTRVGARFHPTRYFDIWGDGYLEAHWVWGLSEHQISAHGFDVGIGYDFPLAPIIGLGPFARFTWMKDPGASNPMFLSVGVSISLMTFTRHGSSVPDEDLDGVADHEDICPAIPIGRHPDPDNAGCPARDRDEDGLVDPEDECPSEPMWPHPDHDHPGCPLADADGDGVPDVHDICPHTFAPDGGDALREGCLEGDSPY